MFYILYLSSLCKRRRWPDPHYECYPHGTGYGCNVRVNHREYNGESVHATEVLAREAAAMRAYLICRNFSVNEGLYPGTSGTSSPYPVVPPCESRIGSTTSVMSAGSRGYSAPPGAISTHSQGRSMISMHHGHGQFAGRVGNSQGVIVVGHSQPVIM